ncbi:hypothetical protein FZC33_11205 [Labrys sp. KNU-23]|uniref:hypothetical protein n=1 Tax=Labrys sp. KNU-23 TaxID=2789216 RepID=UPI0011EBCCD3|nr:hypothetical protein [Labrys sp. KNU-23]QEN86858.1 hypothetical protein FZC33_11205 [Labrys sp. KNU-23]
MAHPAELPFDLPFDGEMPMPAALALAPSYDGPFAAEFAKLTRENPTIDPRRWEQAKKDAAEFLADWGEQAAELGWTAKELFGLHPVAPLTRYDQMGLVWLLNGKEVDEITDRTAKIGATTFYRTTA